MFAFLIILLTTVLTHASAYKKMSTPEYTDVSIAPADAGSSVAATSLSATSTEATSAASAPVSLGADGSAAPPAANAGDGAAPAEGAPDGDSFDDEVPDQEPPQEPSELEGFLQKKGDQVCSLSWIGKLSSTCIYKRFFLCKNIQNVFVRPRCVPQ